MSGAGLSSFDVGFRRCLSGSVVGNFLGGLIAFLTAKTLPLGVEADVLQGASSRILRKGSNIDVGTVFHHTPKDERINGHHVLPGDSALVLKKECHSFCRTYFPIEVAFRYGIVFHSRPKDYTHARHYRFEHNPDKTQHTYCVLYNPFYCMQQFYAIARCRCSKVRVANKMRDVRKHSKILPWLMAFVFFVFCVVDVLVGALLRSLQCLYYVLMFFWHLSGPSFVVRIADDGSSYVAVFGVGTQIFTCFAVMLHSIIMALSVYYVLGFPQDKVLQGFSFLCCGLLAGLTIVGVLATLENMWAANARMRQEAEDVGRVLWGFSGPSPLSAEAASKLAAESGGTTQVEATQTSLQRTDAEVEWQVSCRKRWRGVCTAVANVLYLDAVARGAYLPSHLHSGFGGVTAFSVVEEVVHLPTHFLASLSICGVDKLFGARTS